jgi:predicted nucleic acid-binding protein
VILVDSSVWIDHFNKSDSHLIEILDQSEVSVHPMVIGELALGGIRDRGTVLDLFDDLPLAENASHPEVMALIETRQLYGRGLSFIDAHLLASAAISPETSLWTRDKRLRSAALEMGTAHQFV